MRARHFATFAAGVALAIAAGVWAQAGYPTRIIAQKLTARLAAGNGDPAIAIENINPTFHWRETDGSADNKYWTANVRAEQLQFGVINDANSNADVWLTVDRTGALVDTIALDATSVTLNGVASSDFARLSANNVFTGQVSSGSAPLRIAPASGAPGIVIAELAGAANNREWRLLASSEALLWQTSTDDFSANNNWLRVDRTGATVDSIALSATAITGNAVDMTPLSGSFTASYTNACSTTPTQTVRYYKIGNMVTLSASPAFTCTGDTTTFDTDSTDVPAALRPVAGVVHSAGFGANNNGASVTAMVEINGGEIVINRCGAVTGTCDGGAWTGSGNRGLDSWTLSYVIQ